MTEIIVPKKMQYKDIKVLREQLYHEQKGICPVLKKKILLEDSVLDHQHSLKGEKLEHHGAGLVRGCISALVNSFEGQILSKYRRSGLSKIIPLPDLLINLGLFLKQKNLNYIHPSEKARPKKLQKSSYNLLKKACSRQKKFPLYPKSGILTKPLERLFRQYNIKPKFYK